MRILHTADWHLGKRLGQFERTEEHRRFLHRLLEIIDEHAIDVLIVAGDIFDVSNPSNAALKQYYDFLGQIKNTCCRNVIIIGGNHDSVAVLNAPRDLLRFFDIHVIGGVPDNFEDQIIPIKDKTGTTKMIVCAVPFLRDKDIRLSVAGESSEERERRIGQGIETHYRNFIPYILSYKEKGIPVIATGHLFAAGSQASSAGERNIYVGNLGQISGNAFPAEFDYVALGHLHRPQTVNKMPHVRYSGSPVPLDFSENEVEKTLVIVDFIEGKPMHIKEIPVPLARRLIRIKGDLQKVKTELSLITPRTDELPVWVEILAETNDFIYDLEEQLRALEIPCVEIVFIKQIRTQEYQSISEQTEKILSLNELDPLTVFEKKCATESIETEYEDLMQTFKETLELMNTTNDM